MSQYDNPTCYCSVSGNMGLRRNRKLQPHRSWKLWLHEIGTSGFAKPKLPELILKPGSCFDAGAWSFRLRETRGPCFAEAHVATDCVRALDNLQHISLISNIHVTWEHITSSYSQSHVDMGTHHIVQYSKSQPCGALRRQFVQLKLHHSVALSSPSLHETIISSSRDEQSS